MKYLTQFLRILAFTLAGELLQRLVPLPIPASVYGLVLLFAALNTGLVKLEQVKDAGGFLISISAHPLRLPGGGDSGQLGGHPGRADPHSGADDAEHRPDLRHCGAGHPGDDGKGGKAQ